MVGGATREVKKQYAVLDGVARKIKKSYEVKDGIARLFYSGGVEVNYTGAHTTSAITVGGVPYNLYTLTGSGTLTVSEPVQYWMCGGGGDGASAGSTNSSASQAGGGGAGAYTASGTIYAGTHVVTVASAKGTTTIGSTSAKGGASASGANGATGGTGGGAAGHVNAKAGTGDGVNKYPFGVTSLKAHCGAGGSGAWAYDSGGEQLGGYTGGKGGTNGGNGGKGSQTDGISVNNGGSGGSTGGGKGGNAGTNATNGNVVASSGSNASFYGSGGGGGALYRMTMSGSGGSGYQGVVYLLIPA